MTACLVLAYSSADSMKAPMMLDAPVSGGVPAAEAGTLTFMVHFFGRNSYGTLI